MKNNKSKLTTKYLKTGGYSVLVSCVAIAIVIVINLLFSMLPASQTKIDMSKNDFLEISDETAELVKGIKDEITVYYIAQHGSEDEYIVNFLDKYKELNGKITVKQIDPVVNNTFFNKYAEVSEGGLVVESAKRSKIITALDIYYPDYTEEQMAAYNEYYQYYGSYPNGQAPVQRFAMDGCLTAAVKYVTTDVLPIVYRLEGHNELALSDEYIALLDAESVEVKTLNLATVEAVPEDCDCLFVNIPQGDISAAEAERILTYLKAGGKMMFISYYSYISAEDFPNMTSVLEYYGLKAVEGVVVEGDSGAHYPNYPYILLPNIEDHEINSSIKGYNIFMSSAHGIEQTSDAREGVTITPLLTTSKKSYSKYIPLDDESQQDFVLDKAEGDKEGPFNIAVAASETTEDGKETQIVWVTTFSVLDSSMDMYYGAKNSEFFINSIAWMCEIEEGVSIAAKDYESTYLTITEAQSKLLTAIFAIIIPLAVVATGFVVWYRRRVR